MGAFDAGDTEFRVVERPVDRVFDVVRCAPDEPVELVAECPYTYNREMFGNSGAPDRDRPLR